MSTEQNRSIGGADLPTPPFGELKSLVAGAEHLFYDHDLTSVLADQHGSNHN
jgi:hypothetical protein